MNPIICIAGPTASGKTDLAVALAKAVDGEVVSCDSMQVYRRMDIGTAKPSAEEMQGIPHHMLDVAEPDEDFSVSRYCAMAAPIVDEIVASGKTAIIAGGTGLYMDALIRGNDFAPFPSTGVREALEAETDRLGMETMLEKLRAIDPDSAGRLHRTRQLPDRYHPLWLGLDFTDRAVLYDRINRRVSRMLEAGLLHEIEALLESGIPETCTAMQAIGYKEFLPVLRGERPLEEAAAEVCQASRRYAKRQLTWFRRNSVIHWLQREESTSPDEMFRQARQILREFDT